jgi:membrane-bound lytic murein transglycosylase D
VEAAPDPAERLVSAQEEYFQGVRAYVREDFDSAEGRLRTCREALNEIFADAAAGDVMTREAESLFAKSDYFLHKISERRTVEDDATPATFETAEAEVVPELEEWDVIHGSIAPIGHRDVDRWMRYFLNDGRPVFQKWLNRKSQFVPVYQKAFARYGLPPELIYHSMIESGFSTGAYSWAHAVGLWQFIRSTARTYGLRTDWWVDERRDPVRSTDAAARYLRDLYVEFKDWELALAAYNVGEAKVRRQIRRQKTRNFWQLRLPRETRNHVPKFYAALKIGLDPEKYGFTVAQKAPPATETIGVDFCVDFEVLAKCCGTSPQTIADLNPALVRRTTPPGDSAYPVVVPAGTGQRALVAIANLPEDERVQWAHYRVRRGDTLSVIARRYRTTVRAVMEANRLKSAHRLSIGRDLLIPQGRPSGANPPRYAASQSGGSSASSGSRKIVYTVKKGDTLSEIAERHGTSARQMRRWNRVGRFIRPGQKLTIYAKQSSSRKSSSKSSGSGQSLVVRVRRGDTLWDIARYHGVSLKSLLSANNLGRNDLIRPGDLIKVPRKS